MTRKKPKKIKAVVPVDDFVPQEAMSVQVANEIRFSENFLPG